jgi:hypothetical protein
MGHIGAYALERIAESKALARARARRAEKQAHRRIAGVRGQAPMRPLSVFGVPSRRDYELLICVSRSEFDPN